MRFKKRKWESKEILDAVRDYSNPKFTKEMLENKYSRSISSIQKQASKMGIKRVIDRRIYKINNENFFNKIDTESKSYFLGLMFADGYISNNTNKIFLSQAGFENKYILEEFKKLLKSNNPIIKKKEKGKARNTYLFQFFSKEIRDDLIKNGCTPIKIKMRMFPNFKIVPNYLIRHFIRGFMDGDGSIYSRTDNKSYISFSGTEHLLFNIRNILLAELGNNYKVKIVKSKNYVPNISGYCSFSIGIKNKSKELYEYLYKDSNFYLNRKRVKLENIMKKK